MTKIEMKHQLQTAVGEWVERTCGDSNVLELRHIEVSDETNPLQDI